MPDSSEIIMSANPGVWTCPECKESYLRIMTAREIVEKITKGVKRCNTCTHTLWEWKR
jgi:ribosomal protein L37AE/L43A